MEQQQRQQIKKYVDILWRRKVLIISLFYIGILAGLGNYLLTPKVYQSTTLLSYQQQRVSPNKLSPEVAARIKDIVSTLSQIVTSRTNLEKIIVDLDLYTEMRQKLPMEDAIDGMRSNITIIPSKLGDTFRITYSGGDPRKVVKVTNALAAKFVEENLKYREERASETSAYTSDELQMAKEVLDVKERVMRDYKLKYYNEMPEQRITNVSRLISLQEQYQGKQESIQDLERTKVLISDQLATMRRILSTTFADEDLGDDFSIDGAKAMDEAQRLAKLDAVLENMRLKYTENHPEVKRIKKLIKKLKADILAKQQEDEGEQEFTETLPDDVNLDSYRLEMQLKDVSLNITALNQEKTHLRETIAQYEQWVASAPIREAEWSALTREYGELKRHYDFLVSQNLQAKSMLHLERRQQGSQFKIEDPARFPETPIQPNFSKIMGAALLAGAALGCVVALLLDLLDTSFRDSSELEEALGIPVICSIAHIPTDREVRRAKTVTAFLLLIFLVSSAVIPVIFYYFYKKGHILF